MRNSAALHSPWRFPAAAAAAVTAVIHLWQLASTWQENALVGAGFLALAGLTSAEES